MTGHYLIYIFIAFTASAACGFVFIPAILNFCKRKGLYDLPDARKIHKNAVPRLGGISFLPSMVLASFVAIVVFNRHFWGEQITISPWSVGFFFSLLIIYTVGIIDDLLGLGALTKFTAQIAAAVILPACGLYINNLYGFCGIHQISFAVGAPLTVFIMVFVSNAINLIDGIDGLSAGLSFFALAGFLLCFLREGMLAYSILIAALMGVLVPFLYHNIWGDATKNNKIFMGDSGSLTLGFILGFLFVKFSMDNPEVRHFNLNSMMLAYSLLIVPVFDVVRVSLVRIAHHTSIFRADKNHIHHKLMRTGMSQHLTLVFILVVALVFVALNVVLWHFCNMSVLVCADIVAWLLLQAAINLLIRRQGQKVFLPNPPLDHE